MIVTKIKIKVIVSKQEKKRPRKPSLKDVPKRYLVLYISKSLPPDQTGVNAIG